MNHIKLYLLQQGAPLATLFKGGITWATLLASLPPIKGIYVALLLARMPPNMTPIIMKHNMLYYNCHLLFGSILAKSSAARMALIGSKDANNLPM